MLRIVCGSRLTRATQGLGQTQWRPIQHRLTKLFPERSQHTDSVPQHPIFQGREIKQKLTDYKPAKTSSEAAIGFGHTKSQDVPENYYLEKPQNLKVTSAWPVSSKSYLLMPHPSRTYAQNHSGCNLGLIYLCEKHQQDTKQNKSFVKPALSHVVWKSVPSSVFPGQAAMQMSLGFSGTG